MIKLSEDQEKQRLEKRREWLKSLTQTDRDAISKYGEELWKNRKLNEEKTARKAEERARKLETEKMVEESHVKNTFQIEQDLEKRIAELKKLEVELEDSIDEKQEQIEREKKEYENWVASNNAELKNKGWIKIEPYPKGMSIETYKLLFATTAYILSKTQNLPIGYAKRWYSINKGINDVEIIYAVESLKEEDLEISEKSFGVLNSESDVWNKFMRALENPKVNKFMLIITKSTKDGKPIALFKFGVVN